MEKLEEKARAIATGIADCRRDRETITKLLTVILPNLPTVEEHNFLQQILIDYCPRWEYDPEEVAVYNSKNNFKCPTKVDLDTGYDSSTGQRFFKIYRMRCYGCVMETRIKNKAPEDFVLKLEEMREKARQKGKEGYIEDRIGLYAISSKDLPKIFPEE